MAEHDSSYKLLFSHQLLVTDLVRGFIREDWVEQVAFETLERVSEIGISEDLRERDGDMIWRVRWGERYIYVYLLLEFQSSVDRFMAVRLLTYTGLLYGNLAAAGEIPPGEPLPPVVPIVLYNGTRPWTAKTALDQLVDPGLPGQLHHWQPQLRYLLLDEHRLAENASGTGRNLAMALFQLEHSQTAGQIRTILTRLGQWLIDPEHESLQRAFTVWIKRVLLPARLPGVIIPEVNTLQEMQKMLSEKLPTWTEEWEKQGLERGIEQGLQQGLERGRQEGICQGEAALLRRQLQRRFGPLPEWAQTRLSQADVTQLEIWGDRILDARTLEDVLA